MSLRGTHIKHGCFTAEEAHLKFCRVEDLQGFRCIHSAKSYHDAARTKVERLVPGGVQVSCERQTTRYIQLAEYQVDQLIFGEGIRYIGVMGVK